MKSFVISHLKLVIIITCIVATTIIGGIITFSVIKSNNNVSIQSNERNKDKIQIEIVANSVKIRQSKDPNSQVIGNVYKNEIYSVISEDKESQYKWLEIETSNGIKGYIVGIEAYVKRLETTIVIEEEQKQKNKPNLDSENVNNNEERPNKQPNNNQKPDDSNNTNNDNNTSKTFKVHFNTNGGNTIEPKAVKEWESVGSLPTPTKNGYIFQYWEYDNGRYNDNMYLILQSDITLNAVWKKYIPQEERKKARDVLYNIIEKHGYYTSTNGGYKFMSDNNTSIHFYFTLGNGMQIRYLSSPEYYCYYDWNKTPTSCYIDPDRVSHDKMNILFSYEEQLFNDVNKIYNEYIATGYTLEHLEPTNYD